MTQQARQVSVVRLQERVAIVEQTITDLAARLDQLAQHAAAIAKLRDEVGKLKYELEDMRELP